MEYVRLKAKEIVHKNNTSVGYFFPTEVGVNNYDSAINLHWNWAITFMCGKQ